MRHRIAFDVVLLLGVFTLEVGRARAAEIVVEGESLVAGAHAQGGPVSVQSMTAFGHGWSGGAQLFWAPQGPPASLQLSLVAPAEGEYTLAAFFTRAQDYGIVDVGVNGVHLASFDGFADHVARSERVALGRMHLARGPNSLVLQVRSKSPHSRGYFVGLDALLIEATGEASAQVSRVAPPPVVPHREIPPSLRTAGPVPCAVFQAPRPHGKEQREVLRAFTTLERDFFPQARAGMLRRAFPFAELQSLASVPPPQMGAASQRRLRDLLAALDAMSLDPTYAPTMRDASVANLHERLRDLVDLTPAASAFPKPGPVNDLAATDLFGTLDTWKAVKWVLRVHVVACADADGQHKSTMTKAQVQQAMALAAKVFEPVQLRFVFDPSKDWEEVRDTKLNRWDVDDHDKNAAAFAMKAALRGKIVLFSAWGPDPAKPNGWAANGGTHIWLPSGGVDGAGLCHEMGHYLGHLFHTFPGDGNELVYGDLKKVTAANVDSVIANFIFDPTRNTSGFTNEQAMNGDTFSDTPPDPGNDYWEKKFGANTSCDPAYPTATVPNPKGGPAWVFTPDRANLLSYFFRCPSVPTITPQQTAAILGRLEGTVPQGDNQDLRRLIEGQTPYASSSGEIVLVGKVRNVGTGTSAAGRTAVLESVGDGQTPNTPLGAPVSIGPLAPGDWVLVKVPMPGGLSWKGRACLRISPGDENPANDTLCPEPYKPPVVK